MTRLILVAFTGVILAVWITAGMSLWLVVGPWRLGRSLACRLGLHGRIVPRSIRTIGIPRAAAWHVIGS